MLKLFTYQEKYSFHAVLSLIHITFRKNNLLSAYFVLLKSILIHRDFNVSHASALLRVRGVIRCLTDMRKGESLDINCLSFILLHPRYVMEI